MSITVEPIEICATEAARDSRIPSPAVQQAAFIKSSGALQMYEGPLNLWTPSWDQPWGEITYEEMTGTESGGTAFEQPHDLVGLPPLTLVPRQGRIYEVRATIHVTSININLGETVACYLVCETVASDSLNGFVYSDPGNVTSDPTPIELHVRLSALTPGRAYKWKIQTSQGSIDVGAGLVTGVKNPCTFRILDLGPSADPL
jgi:hypothetical protein